MGERLELRLKSPVGAEPAVYPWPLPVYITPPASASSSSKQVSHRPRHTSSKQQQTLPEQPADTSPLPQ